MFNQKTLFAARSVFNATGYGEAVAIHTYKTDDLIADVTTLGYFPDNFGSNELQIEVGDLLILMTSDFDVITKVTSLSPVGVVLFVDFPTNLVSDSSSTLLTTASGVWAATHDVTLNIYRQNKLCTITSTSLVIDVSTGGAAILFTGTLPVPAFGLVAGGCSVINNSLYVGGAFIINADGTFTVTRGPDGPFDATGDAGFSVISFTYVTV